ncbi:MAG: hypothetical protein ABL904_24745 [Hyphomicrobiaceae bacterium]
MLEAGILAALSVAADLTKAVLPVVVVRALLLRAWGPLAGASVMLGIVISLSLASGTGFVAVTRGAVTAARQAEVDARSSYDRQLRGLDARLEHLPFGRTVGVLDAEIARMVLDRRWTSSKACIAVAGAVSREFCAEVLRLKSERAAAHDRADLVAQRNMLATRLVGLTTGASESDPQAAAVADLLGTDASRLRRDLTVAMAITIELGSVILILLLSGQTLLRWQDPAQPQEPSAANLPRSTDVSQWRRRRDPTMFKLDGSANDAG